MTAQLAKQELVLILTINDVSAPQKQAPPTGIKIRLHRAQGRIYHLHELKTPGREENSAMLGPGNWRRRRSRYEKQFPPLTPLSQNNVIHPEDNGTQTRFP